MKKFKPHLIYDWGGRLFLTSSTEYYKLSTMANMGTMLGLSNGPAVRGSGKSID